MVWQFSKPEGIPSLYDYINRTDRFNMHFVPDLDKVSAVLNPNFYRLICPVFGMPAQANPRSDGYSVELDSTGMVRKLFSDVRDFRHPNLTKAIWKTVGYADFDDMNVMGGHAVRRIPEISEEIALGEKRFRGDIPQGVRGQRSWYWEEVSDIDWEDFVRVTSNNFYELFYSAVGSRVNATRGRRLSEADAEILIDMVNPLSY